MLAQWYPAGQSYVLDGIHVVSLEQPYKQIENLERESQIYTKILILELDEGKKTTVGAFWKDGIKLPWATAKKTFGSAADCRKEAQSSLWSGVTIHDTSTPKG